MPKENGLGHELVDRSPSCKRVIFGKVGGVSATVDLFLNNNGTTTVHYKIGKNQELGLLLAEYLKGTIDPAEFETVNLVLTSIFDDDVDLVFSGIDRHHFRQNLLWHRRNSRAAPVAIKKAIKTGKKRAPNSDDCSGLLVLNPTREFYSIALLSFKSFWHLLA